MNRAVNEPAPGRGSVSVIVVNYNGGPLLTECVRSVLSSSVPVEVFVSDNASTDTSLIELRLACGADPRLGILENPRNLGFARANNRVLERTRYNFILFLNPDCIVQPDTLERMLKLFEHDPAIGMAGCLIRNPDGSEQPGCRRSIPTPWRTFVQISGLDRIRRSDPRFRSYLHTALPIPKAAAPVEAISGAFMLVSRTALGSVGPMDEGYFMHFEDLDLCLRFQQAGWKVMFEPSVQIMHVGGVCTATQPLKVEYYKHRGMARFYRKFFSDRPYFLLHLALLPAIFARFVLRVVNHALRHTGLFHKREPRREAGEVAKALSRRYAPAAPFEGARRVIVTGATSLIGDYLLPGLVNAGYEVHAVSRNAPPYGVNLPGLHWHHADITREAPDVARNAEILIHLAPLAILPRLIGVLGEHCPRRVIGFGSTSVFTKADSALEKERELVRSLRAAERDIAGLGERLGLDWTVFRPTLVYRLGRDKNVTTIAEFFRKFGFFPLVNGSRGLRQPVHAEDLAIATLASIDNPRAFNQAYNLCGGETLTYRDMVVRIADAIGVDCRLIEIPLSLLKGTIRLIALIPRFRHLNPEMATRIGQDMCFDSLQAAVDLGFNPRPFLEDRPG